MGNVNNCLSNPFQYDGITIMPNNKTSNNRSYNNKNIYPRYNYNNKPKLDIIHEEDFQETKSQVEKQPKDGPLRSSFNQIKTNSISSPNDIKKMENKFNTDFNKNIKKNNNQDIMVFDNILFNSTRKSNTNQKNIDNYKFSINEKKNEVQNNLINNSENNFESNKLVNSSDESDLIVLDYKTSEGKNTNKNTNNGYNNNDNNDDLTPKEKHLTNIDNNTNTENYNIYNNIKDNFKKSLNKNIDVNENEPKDNISNNIKNQNNYKQNDNIESVNNYKNNVPYVKPRFNSNLPDNKNNNVYINKKKISLNQINENKNQPNSQFYYSSKIKSMPNSFKINKKKPSDNINNKENNINNLNNRYDNNILLSDKNNNYISNIPNNYQYNNNDNLGNKKLNSEQYKSQIPTQRQFIQNTQEINEQIIYNKNNSTNINNFNYQINKNWTNPEINTALIQNNEIQNIIPSKSQDLYHSKNDILYDNKEQNMSPDERVLYQSATLENIQEDQNSILLNSALYENNETNNIKEQEINSNIIMQNNQEVGYDFGKEYQFTHPNEQIMIKQEIRKKEEDFDANEIINQQKEQEKKNPEYEQTQQAPEEDENDNNEFQHKIISQVEQKEPRDKDSESEIDPKLQEQHPLSKEYQEIKEYINNSLNPVSNDRITFKKSENIDDINQNNNEKDDLEINDINKKKYKSKINENEDDYEDEEENLQDGQFLKMPLTPSKPTDEETPYNKRGYVNKIKVDNIEEVNESEDKRYNNNKNSLEELECKEFEEFSQNGWEKFYPNDRFFKFPKEGIIHDQLIINNDEIYKGDINKNKEKHGFGRFISPNIKRIGMWRRDNFSGWGREIKENGDIFEGKFINGKLNGKGIHKNKNNNTTYIGEYYNSMRHGKGELYTNDFHYKGDFNNNKFEGKGKIEIYNEGEYEGDFKDNLFDGKGMLKWKDGRFYIGELSKGKMNGYGEETFSDGKIYKGNYVDGNKDGHGKLVTADGNIYEVEFRNGEYINNSQQSN